MKPTVHWWLACSAEISSIAAIMPSNAVPLSAQSCGMAYLSECHAVIPPLGRTARLHQTHAKLLVQSFFKESFRFSIGWTEIVYLSRAVRHGETQGGSQGR